MTRAKSATKRPRRRRRIAVVTGSRSEYGLLRSTMEAIASHPGLRLQTVVVGMHLVKRFGYTVRQIERDGWSVDARVPMQRGDDGPLDQATGLSRGVVGIARFLEEAHSDIVLVLGDRIEAMAGALAATMTGRLLAHVHGGDVAAGDVDDALRHSVTKLAHVHLAATREAARRIARLGERGDRVHVVGAPGLDDLLALSQRMPRNTPRHGALVVQHAYGRSSAVEARAMSAVLRAVRGCGLETVAVYPNTDRGNSGVLRGLEARLRSENGSGGLRVVRSLERGVYLRLMLTSRVLVGNSSSGIIESGVAGTPCVNVGGRQKGRLRSGRHIIDARETVSDIRRAVLAALACDRRRSVPPRQGGVRGSRAYGDGQAGRRIADVLATTPLEADAHRKTNTF